MSFLRLNGWTVPIAAAQATRTWKKSGETFRRTARGVGVDSKRNFRRMWECEACFLNPDDADGLINLLSGSGHYFDLKDGFAASTGLQPTRQILSGATFNPSLAGIDGGLGGLTYGPVIGPAVVANIDAQLKEWTVILSTMKENTWVTGALRDDGISYERGIASKSWGKKGRWRNLLNFSEQFTSWAFSAGVTATSLYGVAPNNATSSLLTKSSVTTSTGTSVPMTSPSFTIVTASLYVRKGTAAITDINVYDASAVANRHIVRLTWSPSSAAPTVATAPSGGSGLVFPVEDAGNGWFRVSFTAVNIVPGNSHNLFIYPAGLGTATGTVEVFGAQVENAFEAGPYVKTSGASLPGPTDFYFEEEAGALTMIEEGSAARVVDDLIILPWRASESQLASWTQRNSRWGPLPLLSMDGEVLEGADDASSFGSTLVMGDVLSVDLIQKPTTVKGFGWVNNAKIVRFQLGEIDESFKLAQSYRSNRGIAPPLSPIIWYDAANIDGAGNATLAEGSAVSTWKNVGTLAARQDAPFVGTAPLFAHRAMPQRLSGSLNHTPGVDFNGTTQCLRAPVLSPALTQNPPLVFAWFGITDTVSTTRYGMDGNGASAWRLPRFSLTSITFQRNSIITYAGVTAAADKAILALSYTSSLSSLSVHRVSGGTDQSLNTAGTTNQFTGLTIGASFNATPSLFLDGKVIEIAVFRLSAALSAAEITALFDEIELYFERRYGALPQTR